MAIAERKLTIDLKEELGERALLIMQMLRQGVSILESTPSEQMVNPRLFLIYPRASDDHIREGLDINLPEGRISESVFFTSGPNSNIYDPVSLIPKGFLFFNKDFISLNPNAGIAK